MCGISGIVSSGYSNAGEIMLMNSVISHRGPDDEGFLLIDTQRNIHIAGSQDTSPFTWGSKFGYTPDERILEYGSKPFTLSLGHRRLSILDLTPAGHQPMSYFSGRYWIVFNGEIYNYLEIKNDLQKKGHQFITRTDTEVILAAYNEWGERCLDRFVGMWAFAIYDHSKKEIFIARDRYGIKPLYYWFSPEGSFYFGSEIKQFTVCRGWEAKLNPQRTHDYLIYSFTDHTDETMFRGVYQLPSGSYYKSGIENLRPVNGGRINYQRWYSLSRIPFRGTFEEAAITFKRLFEQSVKEHLSSDVPVGTALSGGLDSSSIVCEVNRLLRNNSQSELQKTFSSCSIDERFDEKKWMDIVIEWTRIDAHFIYPSLTEAIELTPEIVWHQDEPYQSQSAFLGYSVFKLANENGVKVLLNGQGADEYMGGYGQFTAARYAGMIKQFKLLSLFADIKNSRSNTQLQRSSILKGIIFSIIPTFLRQSFSGITNYSGYVKQLLDLDILNINPSHPYTSIPVNYRTVPEISEHLTFYSTLPKYLRWEDRNSMAHSVEARVPFLDHRLVEFAYSLPDDFLEMDGITKIVMRHAMRDLLPEKINNRKDKKGFITPEELWVRHDNPAFFRRKLSEVIEMTNAMIKPETLDYFDDIVSGKKPFEYTYWRLILFGEWIKKFEVEIPTSHDWK